MIRQSYLRYASLPSRRQLSFKSTLSGKTTPVLKPPLLDVNQIVKNSEEVQRNCIVRNLPGLAATVPEILKENSHRLQHIAKRAPLQLQRNKITKDLSITNDKYRRNQLLNEALVLKPEITRIEHEEDATSKRLAALASALPNYTHPEVPAVETEISTIGSLKEKMVVKDHIEIAEEHDILELRAAAKATGHAWYYLKGMGVQLELALVSYAIEMAVKRGWKVVKTPDVVRSEIALACGFRPRDEQGDQIYQLANVTIGETGAGVEEGSLCLAGTAEIPLAAMHIDTVFPEEDLPVKYVGVGTAYRAEAGSRGRESKGLYRVHQFTKVELFSWTTVEQSDAMLEEILELQREIIDGLGLHARILDMPARELGNAACRKFDIEAWMYGRQGWGEITSASNCTDYQSRRLNTRYRQRFGKVLHTHTLNGTAMAVPRIIIAILESGLQEDGSVEIPLPLQKYIGAEMIAKN